MGKEKKLLVKIFLIFIISGQLTSIIEAQEKKDTIPQKSDITISQSPAPTKSIETREDILHKTQEGIDRSISILNIVATSMGVLVALITIVFIIATALGFFEYRRWREIQKQASVDAKKAKEAANEAMKAAEEAWPMVTKLRQAMKETEAMRETIGKISIPLEPALLSEELKTKLDEYGKKIKFLETFGVPLKPEDYYSRGVDFYYKEQFELALKAFEMAIEIKPDYGEAWHNKSVTLSQLGRNDEALKTIERAIEIKPDYADAWNNKGITLGKLDRHDEALKAYESRAIF
ncbi:MAG: tetratricopeptide repeat protein [Candidatus Marinimicrobia bacterium]|nr:tetratricopeptide repeat protein [Candidatus Neomarinimicrobiota bacterium]